MVIIPAFNEAESIGKVVGDIPKGLVREVVVVNNSSTDATETNAYANAKKGAERPDIIVFIDGDYSDHPEQLPELLRPILEEGYDMVIGSRALGARERGSMTPQQVFGNWLATTLIRLFYRTRYTDLGPFRVIKMDKLLALEMKDQTYGWTVEMQLKAAKKKFKTTEVPVNYRRRIGVSKVSGTVKGTILAGYKILYTIFRYL